MEAYCVFSVSEEPPVLARTRERMRRALRSSVSPASEEVDFYRWFFTAAAVRVGGCRHEHQPFRDEEAIAHGAVARQIRVKLLGCSTGQRYEEILTG